MVKRTILDCPIVFDLPYEDIVIRVKIDKKGITFWKRATQGNLDSPRSLDKIIETSWNEIAKAGYCYVGTRTGHQQRGPAASRAGFHYLTNKNK